MSLSGKVCVITGSGSGIGRATALLLAAEGATVALAGRTASKLEAVRKEVEAAGGRATTHPLDVADREAVRAMAGHVLDRHGKVDVLVNSAGHSSLHRRLETITSDEIHSVFDSNLIGCIYCCQAVVPAMLEAGQGTIINVSSLAAVSPTVHAGLAYGAAKAGVVNLSRFLDREYRARGIRTTVILPGEVDTPILDARPIPPSREARAKMVTAQDVAEAIVFVARLPQRTMVQEMIIRPTLSRDVKGELEPLPKRIYKEG